MTWVIDDLLVLIEIGLLALLLMAVMAPLESLGWWAGWRARAQYRPTQATIESPGASRTVRRWVVFLSGIGEASGAWRFPEERRFLDRLRLELTDTTVIDDVFPYLVTSNGLDDERFFNAVWRLVNRVLRRRPSSPLGFLINVRNVFQVMVSVDHRYGPVFNLAQAEAIADALAGNGYPARSGHPVTLVGYSGGGQVSVGAALYLTRLVQAQVIVISIGGAISSDAGLLAADHVYHLYGEHDPVEYLCRYIFAGRWPIARRSCWNRALERGIVSLHSQGPVGHNGAAGYFGEAPHADGTPRVERTVAVVRELIERDDWAARSSISTP